MRSTLPYEPRAPERSNPETSTKPAESLVSFEEMCWSLGVNPALARQADLTPIRDYETLLELIGETNDEN